MIRPPQRSPLFPSPPLSLSRSVVGGPTPASLLGVQRRAERGVYLPDVGWGVGYWRLRDWLRLLAFEIEAVQFGCYRPAVQTDRWLRRWQFMDRVDRKSTRLNSSHSQISYAVFCLKKKKKTTQLDL